MFQLSYTKTDVNPSTQLGFRNLKTFILYGYIHIKEKVLQLMVSYMIDLKFLEIKSYTSFRHLKIHSSILKSLIVEKCPEEEYGELKATKYAKPILELSNIMTTETRATFIEENKSTWNYYKFLAYKIK